MTKKATKQPSEVDAENERLSAIMYSRMLADALLPNVHDTIAPALLGSPTLPARHYRAAHPTGDNDNRFVRVWQHPKPSVAGRKIPLLSRTSIRSTSVSLDDDSVVMTESLHEYEFLTICRADRRVSTIREQPGPALPILDQTGKWGTHHFDFLVIMTSGRKVAVAVKPEEHRQKADEAVAYCNKFHKGKLADLYVVRTRLDMSRLAVANAELILWARRFRTEDHVSRLGAIASTIPGIFSMDLLWAEFGVIDDAFVAAINLIDSGKLILASPELIEPGVKLRYVSTVGVGE